MVERRSRVAPVLIGLAEREIEADPVLHRPVGQGQRLFHRGDVGSIELDRLEIGQAPPRRAFAGMAANDVAIGRRGLFFVPKRALGVAGAQRQADVSRPARGAEPLEDRKLFLQSAERAEAFGAKRQDRVAVRRSAADLVELGQRKRGALRADQQFGQRHPCRGVVGRNTGRAPKQGFGHLEFAVGGPVQPEHVERQYVVRILAQQLLEDCLCPARCRPSGWPGRRRGARGFGSMPGSLRSRPSPPRRAGRDGAVPGRAGEARRDRRAAMRAGGAPASRPPLDRTRAAAARLPAPLWDRRLSFVATRPPQPAMILRRCG